MSRSLSFSITGDFVTRTAREWFWLEGKPWETVQELLLSCMCGTDKSQEELIGLARKVVYGQAKFVGCTADDSYAMVDDDKDLVEKYIGQWKRKAEKAEKEAEEITRKYLTLTEYLCDTGKGYLLRDAGVDDDDEDDLVSPELESYFTQDRIEKKGFTENYGWLEPDGTFHPEEFGGHETYAEKVVKDRGWGKEYEFFAGYGMVMHGDFLTNRKGWALLHNPGMGVAYVTKSDLRPLTKQQRDFLYGYYVDRGLHKQANQYMEGLD